MTEEFAIDVKDLRCELDERSVFTHLDLQVPEGHFVGIFGANGAGKTTLFRALLGLVPSHAATVRILGRERACARSHMGYVSQREAPEMDGSLSAEAFVGAAWQGERWGLTWRRTSQKEAVCSALALVHASHLARIPLDAMSGGQRQRVRIAQALVNAVKILFLDEPLNNLDPQSQVQLLQLTSEFCREKGMTVLMTGHDVNALLPYMDDVLYLAEGSGHFSTVEAFMDSSMMHDLAGSTPLHSTSMFAAVAQAHCSGEGGSW